MSITIINPATQETIQTLESMDDGQIAEAFAAARHAQGLWAATPLAERIAILRRFRGLLVERRETLAATLTSEVGKPLKQSRNELTGVLARIDFFLENVQTVTQTQVVTDDTLNKLVERITYEPLGVIANISAWNYPYLVGCNVFVPALLTGNAVLYKPSEFAALTGLAIASALHDAGVPKDVFIPIVGDGAAGASILRNSVNGVFFTGSYATGKKIAEAVASRMIKMQLELGGKDAVYVAEDVDGAAVAAGIADGAFYNCGQSCCSVERIYVHEQVYESFLRAFVDEVGSFAVGDPLAEDTYIGPLTRAQQVAVLEDQVSDAKEHGATLLLGGKRVAGGRGNFFEPTVFVGVDHRMKLMSEESFGPIIGIQKVASDDEAVALMNDSPYGLTGAVYTPDRNRAERILSQINAGSAYWNCCDRVAPKLPWTGRGHSGMGSTLSFAGIIAFVTPKAWHLRG